MKNNGFETKYFSRAKRVAFWLQGVPFLRMVALNGSLASGKANVDSDIDFFVVTKKDRIWTARFFTTLAIQFFGLRRYGKKIAGRICLNCYHSDQHLALSTKIEKIAKDYANMKVFWADDNLNKKFYAANFWIKKFVPNYGIPAPILNQNNFLHGLKITLEKIINLFGNWLENTLKNYQIKKIKQNPLTKKSPKNAIFISDQELRFHPPKEI